MLDEGVEMMSGMRLVLEDGLWLLAILSRCP